MPLNKRLIFLLGNFLFFFLSFLDAFADRAKLLLVGYA